jgi:hypothetical protein
LPGFKLTRSRLAIGPGGWNVPVPIDGGVYELEAVAPGMKPWRTQVPIRPERDRVSVVVPRLEPLPAPARRPPARRVPVEQGWSRTRWLGVGYAATGVVSLGASGFMLLRALDKKQDAEPYCSAGRCSEPEGQAASEDAVTFGRWATVFSVGGGALLAAGATLYWIGRPDSPESSASVSVSSDPSGPQLSVSGSF